MMTNLSKSCALAVLSIVGATVSTGCISETVPDWTTISSQLKGLDQEYGIFEPATEQDSQALENALGGDSLKLLELSPDDVLNVILKAGQDTDPALLSPYADAQEIAKLGLVVMAREVAYSLPEIDDEVLVSFGMDPTDFAARISELQSLVDEAGFDLEDHLLDGLTQGARALEGTKFDGTSGERALLLAHELAHVVQQRAALQNSKVIVRGWDPVKKTVESFQNDGDTAYFDRANSDLQELLVVCARIRSEDYIKNNVDAETLTRILIGLTLPGENQERLARKFQTLSNATKARHDVAMNSIRNMK